MIFFQELNQLGSLFVHEGTLDGLVCRFDSAALSCSFLTDGIKKFACFGVDTPTTFHSKGYRRACRWREFDSSLFPSPGLGALPRGVSGRCAGEALVVESKIMLHDQLLKTKNCPLGRRSTAHSVTKNDHRMELTHAP